MLIPSRIEQANRVIALFEPTCKLSVEGNRLYFHHRNKKTPASLRSDHRWFENSKVHNWISGTTENYIAQLINWVRDNPRLPLRALAYWNSLGIDKTGTTTTLLEQFGYEDISKVCCIICKAYPSKGLDWYQFGGLIGPCCKMRECYSPSYQEELKQC